MAERGVLNYSKRLKTIGDCLETPDKRLNGPKSEPFKRVDDTIVDKGLALTIRRGSHPLVTYPTHAREVTFFGHRDPAEARAFLRYSEQVF